MMEIFSQGEYLLNNPSLDSLGMGIGVSRNNAAVSGDRFREIIGKNLEASQKTEASDSAQRPGSSAKSVTIDKESKLYEQCEALEVFLLKNMINGMRKTIQKSNLIDTGFAGQMYEDMLYDEYAKDFAENARMGFADMAYLELTGQRGKVINQKF